MQQRFVRVWDLPTRLFHWSLLCGIGALFATVVLPGFPIQWHVNAGYFVLALLIFRLAWGFVGGYWSRFRTFVPSLGGVRAMLSGQWRPMPGVGHGPLGGLSVLGLLAALFVQVLSGLAAQGPAGYLGPLHHVVSVELARLATAVHRGAGKWLLLALIALHLGAVLYFLAVRKRNLIGPMLHGNQPAPHDATMHSEDGLSSRLTALSVLALSAGAVLLLAQSAG